MNLNDLLFSYFRDGLSPKCINCYFMNEYHSQQHSFLPHMHDYLELFYVYQGKGQYMVNGNLYHIKKGDIVICNAGVLHGKDAVEANHLRSYSIGITNLALHNLPDNWLCDRKTIPVFSCGMLTEQVGELFRLLYLLFSDSKN